jgi:prepilin-type N-terminal cleavage/methylation domain-containing protein
MTAPRPRKTPSRRATRGFTLIELLVGAVLFGLLATVVMDLLLSQSRFYDVQDAGNATTQNTRIALKRIGNDVLLVGRGMNALSIDNPDLIVANDGTVTANVAKTDAITLLSIPDSVPQIPLSAAATQGAKSLTIVDDARRVAAGLSVNDLITVHDTNLGNSQVVRVTSLVDNGATMTVGFAAADSLMLVYAKDASRVYVMNTVSYRLNKSDPARPHLERRRNDGAWEKMVPGIEGMTFSYFDSTDTAVTPSSPAARREIRKVRIAVDGRSVRAVDAKGTRIKLGMTTDVTPRNLRY